MFTIIFRDKIFGRKGNINKYKIFIIDHWKLFVPKMFFAYVGSSEETILKIKLMSRNRLRFINFIIFKVTFLCFEYRICIYRTDITCG